MKVQEIEQLERDFIRKLGAMAPKNGQAFLEEYSRVATQSKVTEEEYFRSALAHETLAREFFFFENFTAAQRNFAAAVRVYEALTKRYPAFRKWHRNALLRMGNLQLQHKHYESAKDYYQAAAKGERDQDRKSLIQLNIARANLWSLNLNHVLRAGKMVSVDSKAHPTIVAYYTLLKSRTFLALGYEAAAAQSLDEIPASVREQHKNIDLEAAFLRVLAGVDYQRLALNVTAYAVFLENQVKNLSERDQAFYHVEHNFLQMMLAPTTIKNKKDFIAKLRRELKKAQTSEYVDMAETLIGYCFGGKELVFTNFWTRLMNLSTIGHCHLFYLGAIAIWSQKLRDKSPDEAQLVAEDVQRCLRGMELCLSKATLNKLTRHPSRLRQAIDALKRQAPDPMHHETLFDI